MDILIEQLYAPPTGTLIVGSRGWLLQLTKLYNDMILHKILLVYTAIS